MSKRTAFVALGFLAILGTIGQVASAKPDDEATIRQMAQTMQDAWNKKDGQAFASPFAVEHDYVNIAGLYLPKVSREGNARAHQGLFDGPYKELDLELRAAKVRFLSPEVAVLHIQGHNHPKGKPEVKRQELVITGVVQKNEGKWEIVAFQNTPVQPPQAR